MLNKKKPTIVAIFCFFVIFIINKSNAQNLPSGFSVSKVSSLNFPVAMAFAPDGRIFLLEQEGKVRVYKNGSLITKPFVTVDSVFSQKEKGLLGIAFDPNFSSNKYVYLYYTVSLQGNSYNGTPLSGTGADAPVRNKIVRYTADGDTAIKSSKTTILDLDIIPGFLTNYNHDGGTMHFGQDGKLYVATGENTLWCPCYKDVTRVNCNACSLPFPAKPSQDMTVLHGKILRLNSDGTAPTDNPFYNSSSSGEAKKYIYALGVRNPFTFHIKKGTNDIYFNDVGSGDDGNAKEEINVLKSNDLVRNFGYPNVEGIVNNPIYNDPILVYPHRIRRSGNTNTNFYPAGSTFAGCAITGGTFYSPNQTNWPTRYKEKYFYMDFCDGWINYLDVDKNATASFARGIAGNLSTSSSGGWGSLMLEVAEDGNMYFLSRSSSSGVSGLYKVSYMSTTTVTSINISNNKNTITAPGDNIQFSGSVSPSNATNADIIWTVSPAIANISSEGLLTGLTNGVVTVTGTSDDNRTVFKTSVVSISGLISATSLSLSALKTNIAYPDTAIQLQTTILPESASNKNVTWSIRPLNIRAYLTKDGYLYSTGYNGVVTVTARSVAVTSLTSTILVTFSGQMIPGTRILPASLSIQKQGDVNQTDTSAQFVVDFIPTNTTNKDVIWSLLPSNISATISSNGVFKANGYSGVVTVTAKSVMSSTVTSTLVLLIDGNNIIISNTKKAFSKKDGLLVFPNPTSGICTVKTPTYLGDVEIYVSNEAGQILFSENVKDFKDEKLLNLKHLARGIYMLVVSGKDGLYREMLLLE